MKRPLLIALVLCLLLVGAITLKLRAQSAELAGPPRGSGVIEGTDIDVAAQIAARVERVFVKKGQFVKKDTLLLSLDCADVEDAIAEAQARVTVAEAQYASANANRLAAKRSVGMAWAQAAATRTNSDVLEARRAIAERNTARLATAGSSIAIANLDQSQAETIALTLQQRAATESSRASTAQASVVAAQSGAAEAVAAASAATIDASKSALRRAQLLRRECRLSALRDGYIDEVYLEEGEVASRGAPLVRLIDLNDVKVKVYLPNAEIGNVALGQRAQLTVDAYPSEHFSGIATSISVEAAFTPRNIQTRTDRDRLTYPIEVTVNNAAHRLRPGMPVEVQFVR
jgi:HlyD family secretion protein